MLLPLAQVPGVPSTQLPRDGTAFLAPPTDSGAPAERGWAGGTAGPALCGPPPSARVPPTLCNARPAPPGLRAGHRQGCPPRGGWTHRAQRPPAAGRHPARRQGPGPCHDPGEPGPLCQEDSHRASHHVGRPQQPDSDAGAQGRLRGVEGGGVQSGRPGAVPGLPSLPGDAAEPDGRAQERIVPRALEAVGLASCTPRAVPQGAHGAGRPGLWSLVPATHPRQHPPTARRRSAGLDAALP